MFQVSSWLNGLFLALCILVFVSCFRNGNLNFIHVLVFFLSIILLLCRVVYLVVLNCLLMRRSFSVCVLALNLFNLIDLLCLYQFLLLQRCDCIPKFVCCFGGPSCLRDVLSKVVVCVLA